MGTQNDLNLKKLSIGRVDAILVSDIILAKRLIDNSGNKELFEVIPIDKEDFIYFIYIKKTFNLDQAKIIDNMLHKVLKSKEIDPVILKYFKKEEMDLITIK
jgi:ABC-type amino acid transport substrate-binding protein